ncbi:MAG: hypothetical protein HDS62_02050 [Bacteroidales bacterium]|nr:hypothetical protein [Bacteroidales bacterium]
MTPGEILKQKIVYPNLQDMKLSDPDKYREITKTIILDKLSETLPYYNEWQTRNNEYPVYEASLTDLEDVLSGLDFSIYDMGLEGKRELTEYFYQVCSPYRFQEIVDIANSYDLDTSLKIKNLVNRSFRKFYSNRQRILSNIKKYVPNILERGNPSILNYVPFQNPKIGIEWLSQCKFITLSEICEGWILLLCIDLDLFSPETFHYDLIDFVGRENADLLIEKLAIFLAGCPYKKHPFISIERQLLKRVAKYRKLLNKFHILSLPMRELKVKTNKLQYDVFTYLLPYRLTKAQQILFKTKMDSLEEISIVIPNESNSSETYFKFLFKNDEDKIFRILTDISDLNPYSENKNETRARSNSNENKVPKDQKTLCSENEKETKDQPNSNERTPKDQKNSPYISTIDRIIAKSVMASELRFNENIITFTNANGITYSLRSVRIRHNFNPKILEKINHKFNLVKDWSGKRVENKIEHKFLFEPANDLSFLLAEIERLTQNHYIETDDTFPQSGEFEIPWRFVKFYDGTLTIIHPNPSRRGTYTPYHFRNSDILKSFEDIRPYIEKRSPKLRVQAVDGVITCLLNFKEFMSVVAQYKDWEKEEEIDFINSIRPNKDISKEVFARNRIIKKSPYLSYLSSLQHDDFTIKYLLERVIHESGQIDTDEYGYLFTIKSAYYQTVLLYENISDSSRSSILFYIDPSKYEEAVEVIRKFLASEIKNKRQKLSYGQIRFNNPSIRMIKRIKHTDFIDWKYNLIYNL